MAARKSTSKAVNPAPTKALSNKEVVLNKYPKPSIQNIGKLFIILDKKDGKAICPLAKTVDDAWKLAAHRVLTGR